MTVSKKVHMLRFTPASLGLAGDPGRWRCILRYSHPKRLGLLWTPCGVREVRLIPQYLRALPMNFLLNRLIADFLRGRQ